MNDLKGIIEDCNKSDLVSKEAIKKVIEIIGQEEWNDLYDGYSNICTTMGELIITLKGIADIEKENKELKTIKIPQLEGRIASIRGAHSVDCKKLNAKIEQVERLKKENAELKKKNGNLVASSKTIISLSDEIEARTMNQLTKAKEIILRLYNSGRDVLMCRSEEKAYDNLSEAINDSNIEQFLKEIEK